MTKARVQPFCKKYNINIGCYDNNSRKILPLSVTERNKALYLYNHHFCLIWKTQGVSFSKAIEELKSKFKIVNNYISPNNVNSFIKYEYKPKKIESQLTNFLVYDIETYNNRG